MGAFEQIAASGLCWRLSMSCTHTEKPMLPHHISSAPLSFWERLRRAAGF
jgi:hypothetical protein